MLPAFLIAIMRTRKRSDYCTYVTYSKFDSGPAIDRARLTTSSTYEHSVRGYACTTGPTRPRLSKS